MAKEPWYEQDDPAKVARSAGWRIGVWIGVIIVVCALVSGVVWGIGVGLSNINGKGNAIKTKNDAKNRIQAQELFVQTYNDIQAQVKNVKIAKRAYQARNGAFERTNYFGAQQVCQQAVADYDALVRKYTAQDFRPADLPAQIDESDPAFNCQQ